MNSYSCLLCLGSNFDRHIHLANAREALKALFTDIRFSTEMETEAIGGRFLSPFSNQTAQFETSLPADEVRALLKGIEKENGRLKEDKTQGIVKLDIDLLMYGDEVLKAEDMERDFVKKGLEELGLY